MSGLANKFFVKIENTEMEAKPEPWIHLLEPESGQMDTSGKPFLLMQMQSSRTCCTILFVESCYSLFYIENETYSLRLLQLMNIV